MTRKADPVKAKDQPSHSRESTKPLQQDPAALIQETDPLAAWQALHGPAAVTPAHILSLQRLVGNRAVSRLIQAKLAVGPASDPHERQADQVAEQVVGRPQTAPRQPPEEEELQIEPLGQGPLVQRAVMTSEDWLTQSALRGQRRSKLLKTIDAALQSYHQLAGKFDIGRLDDTGVMMSSYQLYDVLRELRGHILAWQGQEGGSRRKGKVAELKEQVDGEIKKLVELRHAIQTAPKKAFQLKSPDEAWTAKWSGADHEYILQCRGGSAPFRDKVTEGLTISAIKWSSATKALVCATRQDGVPSLWEVEVGQEEVQPEGQPEGPPKMEPFVKPPVPVVGGGKKTLKAVGYEERDIPAKEETVDMEKKLFRDLGTSRITDIHALAGKILENLRAGEEIQYTSKDISIATLRAGMETEAVCHAIAMLFRDVVNKMALASDLPQTAEVVGEGPEVITEKITAGFLGRGEKEPSNLVGSYSQSGRALTYGKPLPGRVCFKDHTWVKIEGKHYDPVSGLNAATKPPVQKMEKGPKIAITLNGNVYQEPVYEKDGLRMFKLPVPDVQAEALLSAPLAEAWIVLTG